MLGKTRGLCDFVKVPYPDLVDAGSQRGLREPLLDKNYGACRWETSNLRNTSKWPEMNISDHFCSKFSGENVNFEINFEKIVNGSRWSHYLCDWLNSGRSSSTTCARCSRRLAILDPLLFTTWTHFWVASLAAAAGLEERPQTIGHRWRGILWQTTDWGTQMNWR